jgi:hypothetical protein
VNREIRAYSMWLRRDREDAMGKSTERAQAVDPLSAACDEDDVISCLLSFVASRETGKRHR